MKSELASNVDAKPPAADWAVELSRQDAILGRAAPVMSHLLTSGEQTILSDEIVARTRGMLVGLAQQVLGREDAYLKPEDLARYRDLFVAQLCESRSIVEYCHALAAEWQVIKSLQSDHSLDPVLPPLFQQIIASSDSTLAGVGMQLLTAQSRFVRQQQRMAVSLDDLPPSLLDRLLKLGRNVDTGQNVEAYARLERAIREKYDESLSRPALLLRALRMMPDSLRDAAFAPLDSGLSLFLTNLAVTSGQDREAMTLSLANRHEAAYRTVSSRSRL